MSVRFSQPLHQSTNGQTSLWVKIPTQYFKLPKTSPSLKLTMTSPDMFLITTRLRLISLLSFNSEKCISSGRWSVVILRAIFKHTRQQPPRILWAKLIRWISFTPALLLCSVSLTLPWIREAPLFDKPNLFDLLTAFMFKLSSCTFCLFFSLSIEHFY